MQQQIPEDPESLTTHSITMERMMAEKVEPDTFKPPHHKLRKDIETKLGELLKEYQSQFAQDETTIGTTSLTKMTIDTRDSEPVSQKPYPIAMKHYKWVKDEINKLLTAKVIWGSWSSWSAPIIVVPKGDGGKHLVIDYHALNKITWKFIWPMPKVEDIFAQLNGAKYFSTLDLWAGYHHIPLDDSSIPKTAFTSPFGKYEYIKVPFRLAQAPAYFQELMTGVLKDFPFAIAYLDDIIIFSRTAEEHLYHIRQVFKKLWNAHLSMKLSKCYFFAKEIQYLGHILSTTGIRPLPLKTQAIKNMHPPKTAKQVFAFLGHVGYYRKLIKDFEKMAKLLTLLTHHKAKFEWTPAHHTAFMTLEGSHYTSTYLTLPWSSKEIHSIHRCIGWCMWSTTITGTQWSWISNSLLISHIHWNTEEMEYPRTGSLWSVLCHYQMELLPSRSWHHSL